MLSPAIKNCICCFFIFFVSYYACSYISFARKCIYIFAALILLDFTGLMALGKDLSGFKELFKICALSIKEKEDINNTMMGNDFFEGHSSRLRSKY